MKILGITGGSGSGKTTLLRAVEQLGGLGLDCDAIYHCLLETDDALSPPSARAFPARSGTAGSTARRWPPSCLPIRRSLRPSMP